MKRKLTLAGTLFLASGMILLLSQPVYAQESGGAILTGVWYWENMLPAAMFGAGAHLPSILIFHNDGTAFCSDALAFGGASFNPCTYTPFYGKWERIGPHGFTVTCLSLRFKEGTLIGFARAVTEFAFSGDFDHIEGELRMEFLDSAAGPLMVPDPLDPAAVWTPSAMPPLKIKAGRVGVVPY